MDNRDDYGGRAYGDARIDKRVHSSDGKPHGKRNHLAARSHARIVGRVEIVLSEKYILWYILFIILYRFAEGFAVKIVPLFLKAATEVGGLGLTTKDIGLVYGFGAAAFVAGSILGGYFIYTLGLRKALICLCCAFNVPFVVYLMLAVFRPESLWWIGGAVVTEYFGYGFGFVGLMLFMMQQVAPGKHQMSHYAFATAIMNLGVMLPSMASGYLSDWLGYKTFFVWVLIATIPAFLVTIFVPFGNPDITPKSPKGNLDTETDISKV